MENERSINKTNWQPALVRFEITSMCSMSCAHCYQSGSSGQIPDMTLESVKEVIDRIAATLPVKMLFLGGEPSERKDIVEIIRHAKSKGVYAGIDSNASCLGKEVLHRLKAAGLDKLNITVYGTSAEVHDHFTQPGHFAQIIEALETAAHFGMNVDLAFLLTRRNFFELFKIARFAKHYGAKDVHLDVYMAVNSNDNGKYCLSFLQFLLFWGILRPLLSKINMLPGSKRNASLKVSCCERRTIPLVKPDGEIWPCLFYPVSVGNILKDGWDAIRQKLVNFEYDKSICRRCVETKLPDSLNNASVSNAFFSVFVLKLHGLYNKIMKML